MTNEAKFTYYMDDPSSNVLLIDGPWGVGKTFFVGKELSDYITSCEIKGIKCECVKLSLFGINDIKELKERLIEKTPSGESIINGIKKMGAGIINCAAKAKNLSFDANSFKFFKPSSDYVELKKKNTKVVIVMDDIERKDRKISLIEILGLIDSLKIEKTKIIIISNSVKFDGEDDENFKRFKEKIVDDEIRINHPSVETKKKVIISDYKDFYGECDNLRTIKKFDKYCKKYSIDDDNYLQNIVFDAMNALDMNIDYRQKWLEKASNDFAIDSEVRKNMGIDMNDEEGKKQIDKQMEYIKKAPLSECLFNILVDEKKYTRIDRKCLKDLCFSTVKILENKEFEKLKDLCKVKYISSERLRYKEYSDLFYAYDEDEYIEKTLDDMKKAIDSGEYDVASLLKFYCNLLLENYDFKKQENKLKCIEETIMDKISDEIVFDEYDYSDESLLLDPIIYYNKKEIIEGINEKFFEAIFKKFNTRFDTVDLDETYCDSFIRVFDNITIIYGKAYHYSKLNFDSLRELAERILYSIIAVFSRKQDLSEKEWKESKVLVDCIKNHMNFESLIRDSFINHMENKWVKALIKLNSIDMENNNDSNN